MASKKILAIVTPKEWQSRTSIKFVRRASIVPVDQAYQTYYQARSEQNSKKLHEALTAYLRAKGGFWDKVERNVNSGGLMKYMWEHTAKDEPTPETRQAERDKSTLESRIPETRHGVLYLWEHTHVDTQWGLIILEGGLTLGASAVTAGQKMQNFKAGDHRAYGYSAGAGAGTVGGIGTHFAMGKKTVKETKPLPQLPEPERPPLTRANAAYTLQDVETHPTNWQRIQQQLGAFFHYCYQKIKEFVDWLWFKIVTKQGAIISGISKIIEKVVLIVLGEVAKAAAPFVGAGIDIGRGVVSIIKGIKTRLEVALQRAKFMVSPGHPELIANAIEKQMNWAIGKGVWDVCKGGAKLGLTFVSAGAGAIAAAVAAGIEFAAKVILRIVEGRAMKAFIEKVHNAWKIKGPAAEASRPAIAYNTEAFNELFSEGCNASACVPMLTLNSGISGDQMMFMRMFDDTTTMITQESFNAATTYFRKLKSYGQDYLTNSGFRFTSTLPDVQGYLHAAMNFSTGGKTLANKVLTFLS